MGQKDEKSDTCYSASFNVCSVKWSALCKAVYGLTDSSSVSLNVWLLTKKR